MFVEIISPEKIIFNAEVEQVQVPGVLGKVEFLSNHAPFITVLSKGQIIVVDKEKKRLQFPVEKGVVQVLKNKTLLLIEQA